MRACAMAGLFWSQLRAILRKNWVLIKRNPRDLLREVGIPVLLLSVRAPDRRLSRKRRARPHRARRPLAPTVVAAARLA